MKKQVRFTKKFFDREIKAGSFFIREKYLTGLPLDWIDCVTFCAYQGWQESPDSGMLVFDDEQTIKYMELLQRDNIRLFILNEEKQKLWQLLLCKEKNPETGEYVKFFIGGENLREFCDEKNLFYKSALATDGGLLSSTNMMWLKEPGEDCTIPQPSKE